VIVYAALDCGRILFLSNYPFAVGENVLMESDCISQLGLAKDDFEDLQIN
jgi:hypothetical protein